MPFDSFGLSPLLLRALGERGIAQPTAVQVAAIPIVLAGADVQGQAQTGSGKTLAFALPIAHAALTRPPSRPRRLRALVLVPTRELAAQVADTFVQLLQGGIQTPRVVALVGGVSVNPQLMALRGGADIVVATPGRLLDVVDHGGLHLADLHTLVLDEADRLLELGFADELGRIFDLLPVQRQNLFFSATYGPSVQAWADRLLRDPVRIESATTPEAAPDIVQRAIEVDTARRTPLLRHLIQQEGWSRVLVFVATQYATELVVHKLGLAGLQARAFHGELSQGARTQVLADFKASRVQVVVATDVAARGLDVTHLPVVVNYDLPRSPTDHVHRIGRTGRAGRTGLAVSFITARSEAHFRLIEKRQGLRVPRERIEGFEPIETAETLPPPLDAQGGVKGRRPSKKDKLRAAAQALAARDAGQEP